MRWRVAVLALAMLAASSEARAQSSGVWWGGVGLSMPSGNTADGLSSGWLATAGLAWDLPSKGWGVQAEGLYTSNGGKSGAPDLTMMGLMGNLSFDFNAEAEWHPYTYAGLGWMSSKRSGGKSSSDLATQVGGGVSYKASADLHVWADVRYLNVGTGKAGYGTWPIAAGISMPWGGKK